MKALTRHVNKAYLSACAAAVLALGPVALLAQRVIYCDDIYVICWGCDDVGPNTIECDGCLIICTNPSEMI